MSPKFLTAEVMGFYGKYQVFLFLFLLLLCVCVCVCVCVRVCVCVCVFGRGVRGGGGVGGRGEGCVCLCVTFLGDPVLNNLSKIRIRIENILFCLFVQGSNFVQKC